jgi:hypothetical protein
MADLHVRRGDKVLGPFPPDKIKQMIADDKIRQNDLIRVEGDDQWNSIRDIPNLAKLFGSDNPSTAERKKSSGTDSASSDPQKMFVKRADAVRGPLTLKAVQDGIAAGKIGRADQIGPRNTGPWKQAGSLLNLFPTDEVVSDDFEGFDDDDVETLDDWEQLAEDEQSGNTYRFTPRQTGMMQPRTVQPGMIQPSINVTVGDTGTGQGSNSPAGRRKFFDPIGTTILGVIFGCIVGFFAAHYFPFFGGLAMTLGQPFSPARYGLVPGHILLCVSLFGGFGLVVGLLNRNSK